MNPSKCLIKIHCTRQRYGSRLGTRLLEVQRWEAFVPPRIERCYKEDWERSNDMLPKGFKIGSQQSMAFGSYRNLPLQAARLRWCLGCIRSDAFMLLTTFHPRTHREIPPGMLCSTEPGYTSRRPNRIWRLE